MNNRKNYNLLELDINKLLIENKIEDVIEVEKLLDAEIERKRVELRLMVGDRYKDVLIASDAIKNMKTISQGIVNNIQNITDVCEDLISSPQKYKHQQPTNTIEKNKTEERVLIVQIRLAIFMNEQIWIALDSGNNITAAQFFLLAQHIHMGLNLTNNDYLVKLAIIKQIKNNLNTLKEQIFRRIEEKLESVEINAKEISSNLNSLLLLQNQSTNDLLDIFIAHRHTALKTVMNESHPSVRVQIGAMVTCLITTVHLLHDCFMSGTKENGLIWLQLEEIVNDSSIPTISKVDLPNSPLNSYIPELILQFRPKYRSDLGEPIKDAIILEKWLQTTEESVKYGLENSLKLVTNIKGLHIIREEALKIELPGNWEEICSKSKLPANFDVWYNFFQNIVTNRVSELITKKIAANSCEIQAEISKFLEDNEDDLRRIIWVEESGANNPNTGLFMLAHGYSKNVAKLCDKLDEKYLALLIDVSQYLYGREYNTLSSNTDYLLDSQHKRKFIDKARLEEHLRIESTKSALQLSEFLEMVLNKSSIRNFVMKSIMCARFLHAVLNLCTHFNKCCTFNNNGDDWNRILANYHKTGMVFWGNWVNQCVASVENEAQKRLNDVTFSAMISTLLRWDVIDIQEQTEEKVFKSQIKVPLKPSLALNSILNKLNDEFTRILPQTLPKKIHLETIERSSKKILILYNKMIETNDFSQNQALQYLFDVKYLTAFCIERENGQLIAISQQICDKLRAKIDPFDLDVFYSHLQNNVKRAILQSQVIFGCLIPTSGQLANLGVLEKCKEQDKESSILAITAATTNSWFPHLPISVPTQKMAATNSLQTLEVSAIQGHKIASKKPQDTAAGMRSSAAALFGGLASDWFKK